MDKPTTSIYLDTRSEKKDKTYPVKLRVTYQRISRLYNTDFSLTEEDFTKATGEKPRGEFKDLSFRFKEIEEKARNIILKMNDFSFEKFKARFLEKGGDPNNIFSASKLHEEELKKEGRIEYANTFKGAMNSLKGYYPHEKLFFSNITLQFLNGYERWMKESGKSDTTIGIYARSIRRLIKIAIKEGYAINDPFLDYKIPTSRNIKKALVLSDIKKIVEYQPEEKSSEQFYRDIWLFSYLGNGINIKDICLLKYHHIMGENIYFSRAKTKNTSKNQKPIIISLIPQNKAIIAKWGNSQQLPNQYIFPILNDGLTPEQQQAKIKQLTKQVNKYMKRIATNLKIKVNISTYTARHSYATVLKRSGASLEFISESLGHSDLKVTELYLDSFEDETRIANTKKLLEF